MANNNNSNGGLGLCGTLFVVFIVLKLCKVITWSWWWVCAPLWIPIAIVLIVSIIYKILDNL